MEAARLVHMTNQIAAFFEAYPEDQAIAQTADHLRKFWDPRMRKDLIRIAEGGGEGLSEIALAAAREIGETAPGTADAK